MMKKLVYWIFTPGGVCSAALPGAIFFRPSGASGVQLEWFTGAKDEKVGLEAGSPGFQP